MFHRNLEIIEESSQQYYQESPKHEANKAAKIGKVLVKQDSLPSKFSSNVENSQNAAVGLSPSKAKLPTSKSAAYVQSSSLNSQSNEMQLLPSKDSVIKKMKKITKAVQDLFKATKQSDFSM